MVYQIKAEIMRKEYQVGAGIVQYDKENSWAEDAPVDLWLSRGDERIELAELTEAEANGLRRALNEWFEDTQSP